MKYLPQQTRSAVDKALHSAQQRGAIFDVYGAASQIYEDCSEEQVSIEDLVDAMISRVGGIQAVEIFPPALIVEIAFLVDNDDTIVAARCIADRELHA